jgi:hypothetical protein
VPTVAFLGAVPWPVV